MIFFLQAWARMEKVEMKAEKIVSQNHKTPYNDTYTAEM